MQWLGVLPVALFPHPSYWNVWNDTAVATEADPIHVWWRLAYALLWGVLFFTLARWRFERRELTS